jgi:hypothetical protein
MARAWRYPKEALADSRRGALRTLVLAAVVGLALASTASARLIIIGLGEIEAGKRVTGFVTGLTDAERAIHKVLVYVHTDQWHIHPRAKGGAGKSFAMIGADGKWEVQSVRGKTKADRVGAIIVPLNYTPPAKIKQLADVPHTSITIRNNKDTPDYGKL